MTNKENEVALVFDPDFGERLRLLTSHGHVWVVDTTANRVIAEQYWQEHSDYRPESGITTFKVSEGETKEESYVSILESIDLHHGEYSSASTYSALEVFGLPISDRIKCALEEIGFETLEETVEGFRATRK